MHLLFICGRNRLRSPTAEHLFAVAGVETCSAGVNPDADELVSPELIEWADIILVMEPAHRAKLNRMFNSLLKAKRVVCLDIPDDYEYMQPELIELLWQRVPLSVPVLAAAKPD